MSTPPVVSHQYTPEDLLTMPDGHHFDLVDGHLVERHMGAESSWIAQQVNRHLGNYVAASQGGLVLGPDCGYQIFADDPNQVRFPDGCLSAVGDCRTMCHRAVMFASYRICSLRWCRLTIWPGKSK